MAVQEIRQLLFVISKIELQVQRDYWNTIVAVDIGALKKGGHHHLSQDSTKNTRYEKKRSSIHQNKTQIK